MDPNTRKALRRLKSMSKAWHRTAGEITNKKRKGDPVKFYLAHAILERAIEIVKEECK